MGEGIKLLALVYNFVGCDKSNCKICNIKEHLKFRSDPIKEDDEK